MPKGSKFKKLKSVLKKMQSFKLGSRMINNSSSDDDSYSYGSHCSNHFKDQHAVYVGQSRRRYLVSSDVVYHPLFKEIVEKSGDTEDSITTVGCEVVLFDHLLWMLENADPHQPDSLDELVEFYSC